MEPPLLVPRRAPLGGPPLDFLSAANLDKQHLPPRGRVSPDKNHLGGISAGQFPQAAVSQRLAPRHLTPLSLLQFILLTANWAKGGCGAALL